MGKMEPSQNNLGLIRSEKLTTNTSKQVVSMQQCFQHLLLSDITCFSSSCNDVIRPKYYDILETLCESLTFMM